MPKIPLIRQYVFEQVTSTLENRNANVERALARNDIPDWRGLDGNDVVPLVHFIKAMEAGARATGDEEFSMRVAEEHGLDSFADYGRAIQSGITVFDAMRIACRLIGTQVPTLKWWIAKEQGGALLCRKQLVRSPDLEQALTYLERYTMLLLLNIIRTGAGPGWSPPAAFLSSQRDDVFGNWVAFEAASVTFEAPYSAIFVPNRILILPLQNRPAPDAPHLIGIEKKIRRDQLGKDIVDDVRLLAHSLLRQKSANLNTLAEVTLMSPRTIQRRLAEKGQSFAQLVEQVRFQNAVKLLDQDGASVSETSELLGYEHPQHFIRAFRRWAGISPGQYHRMRMTQDS